jgi:hypothetical protein
MASRTVVPCDHDLRPGTTVCLRCQHAARGAKRARQRQLIARGGAAVLALGSIVAVGVAGVTAWRARFGTSNGRQAVLVGASRPDSTNAGSEATGVLVPASLATGAAPASDLSSSRDPSGAERPTSIAPVIPIGRTALRDTMVADRMGDTVRVGFDLLLMRTRRPDKFEWIMRTTLPQVFGGLADSALRALPAGSVARAGDLINTLPAQGIRIPLADGRLIAVWPETRPGRDGPIVVAYRALASR